MTRTLAKISLILGLASFLFSCNAVKHVDDEKFLLTENTIVVDSTKSKDAKVYSLLAQKPNKKLLGVPLEIFIYNLADPQPDSTHQKWLHKKPKREERLVRFLSQKQVDELGNMYVGFNKWLQKSGNAPSVIDQPKIDKSLDRLTRYYASFGYFNNKVDYVVHPDEKKEKRASITYNVERSQAYFIDSISENIASPVIDSLYRATKSSSFIKKGNQYAANDFVNERDRLTILLRNSGLYYFDQDYVGFEADTVDTGHKANITYLIPNRKISDADSTITEPFKVHTVNEVRIVTDYNFENRDKKFTDTLSYRGYKLFSYGELKFKPKAITNAISIIPKSTFSDVDRSLTYNQLSNLRIFRYPNISYQEDPADTTGTGLIATILLTPQKKYTLGVDLDAFTSTIQQFGIGFSATFMIRNIFKGAETLEISGLGRIGASKDAADENSGFFNNSEFGGDIKLSFPRILFPINTNSFIPKYMSPFTSISLGANAQENIGLDRRSLNAIYNYNWKPSKIRTNQIDLINIQYVRNFNIDNYYNIYNNAYNEVNDIAQQTEAENPGSINPDYYTIDDNNELQLTIPNGIDSFIDEVLLDEVPSIPPDSNDYSTIKTVNEREIRLTENNLIFSSNFTWIRDTRENILDNSFSRIRWKVEFAGNLLDAVATMAGANTNADGNNELFGVVYSQYGKIEGEYIKHWELEDKNIIAFRTFMGVALPFGNSNSIPFTRSYFAGGTNDNRGWQAYDLGPGSSGSKDEFNEANFKLAFNGEYRYTLLGSFKGAIFADIGNIWNLADNIDDDASKFNGLEDLQELAIATGLGFRYDFGFFVFRFDVGFKTHDPARPQGERWFKDYNFANAVYNIGINYPF